MVTSFIDKVSPAFRRYVEVPASLHQLDRALSQRQFRRCGIAAIGDSLYEGRDGSSYLTSLVPRIMDSLRGRFPTPGQGGGGRSGGLGTISAAWSIEGGGGPQDFIPAVTGTVTKNKVGTSPLGLGRRSINLTTGATLTFTSVRCTGLDIEYAKTITPSGGFFTYSIDGAAAVSVSTAATRTTLTAATIVGATTIVVAAIPSEWQVGTELRIDTTGTLETAYISAINTSTLTITLTAAMTSAHASGVQLAAHANGGYVVQVRGLTEGNHVLVITAGAGTTATILAVDFFLNDENKGVHVYNGGLAGIRADQYLSTGATDHWVQSLVARKVDAVICELYINDSGVQTPSTYIGNLTSLRTRINTEHANVGLPQPSWIQLIPFEIDPGSNRYLATKQQAYFDALYAWQQADTSGPGGKSGIFLVDGSRSLPRSDSWTSSGYWGSDRIHPTDAGATAIASAIANSLALNGALG